VILDGETITGLPTPQIIRRGLGSVPEARPPVRRHDGARECLMGAFTRSDKAEIAQDYARMMTLFPRLAERASRPPARCRAASSRWSRWRAR
jgi:branched-chain amino acid transport system ATP-binding protein